MIFTLFLATFVTSWITLAFLDYVPYEMFARESYLHGLTLYRISFLKNLQT